MAESKTNWKPVGLHAIEQPRIFSTIGPVRSLNLIMTKMILILKERAP